MIIRGNSISMTRGDTEGLRVSKYIDEVLGSFVVGDTVYFTVKRKHTDTEKAAEKSEKADEKADKKEKKLAYKALIAENKAATTVAKLASVVDNLLKELSR